MTNVIPRCEHPRPDQKRDNWINLNGLWDFEIDNAKEGIYKGYATRREFSGKICVPFSPESVLSGVGYTDFINSVWYTRPLDIPTDWAGKRVIFHVGACDYKATVFVNGKLVGTHSGGYISFKFDITDYLSDSDNFVTVYAEDDLRSERQMSGKQCHRLNSEGCHYTRTTGIWQTVWLEAVEPAYTVNYKASPNISDPSVTLDVITSEASIGGKLTVSALYNGKEVGQASVTVASLCTTINIKLSEKHLWEVGCGRLYDLKFCIEKDGKCDILNGYFGLREVSLTKEKGLQINGKTVFGRFVLDQGFYPDGIITAPSDDALIYDIETSMKCGFNGARLHQKVFEPRFLYHADRLGYMVWGETANWGLDPTLDLNIYNILPEWIEEIERDFSHPSIIGWCPTNETWDVHGRRQSNIMLDMVYDVTKALDKTRPVITSSGSFPTERTDVHDVHDYEQDPEKFKSYYSEIEQGIVRDQLYRADSNRQISKTHLPIFVSEYGGIKWVIGGDQNAWGYGLSVKDEEEYFSRLKGLTDALLDNKHIFAYCYTQLTDVEQEQNGVLTYNRRPKFPLERYAEIFGRKSVIED